MEIQPNPSEEENTTGNGNELTHVRAFGLKCAIVFVCTTPHFLYGLKYVAALQKVAFDLPETTILTVCLGGVGAIIAFGYKSRKG